MADDTLTDEQIAEKAGVTRAALSLWKQHPDFKARVAGILEAVRQKVLTEGIADRVNRVKRLNRDWERMQRVIEQRAADSDMEGVPGGDTGLLVHQVKGVGKGEDFQLIDLYVVDAGLLAELRNTEKQAAQELGQWVEKSETENKGRVVLDILKGVSMDDL